ncbi:glutamine amidotransferase [Thermochromatium tepidum]|jgi:GMP synthase - Glutamine amidotransferase domain|uniref:Glutamine amidotransferase n=1 Tax=Thermochromatium tepidum ATCC 43061 TaxID=316276 RepID=A0A6I6EA47_THETI|nr:glutamine amidotransferase [Thermochromatium tepidum]QGU32166.1 glutamine amidotransferase [Thermochromatium tepidum ATCC 43061]
MKTAVAIRHVAFEDLGSFAGVLTQRGWVLRDLEAGIDRLGDIDPIEPDLLVVLGGPIGAYEEASYPFIRDALRLLERRLQSDRPTLGICLGAQMMARALGARVYPGPDKEIGWTPLRLSPAGQRSPLANLDGALTSMLHWHGDTFDLPPGATRLASTDLYLNQAFSWGRSALGLQCHPEIRADQFERWLIGHAVELNIAGISIPDLRAESARLAPTLEQQGRRFFDAWLTTIGPHA